MKKTHSVRSVAGSQRNYFKLRKSLVNLGDEYRRLAPCDRRPVMRILEQFSGNIEEATYWDRWSMEEAKSCFLKLKPISPKMANDLRRWASELLKTGGNDKLALKNLMLELTMRTWI
jgi:hypothetical protein